MEVAPYRAVAPVQYTRRPTSSIKVTPPVKSASSHAGTLAATSAAVAGMRWRALRAVSRERRGLRSSPGKVVGEVATLGKQIAPEIGEKPAPLQIVQIDLEKNQVVLNEENLQRLESSLQKSGVSKMAVVGVMGAFRTGKSFLLDLMLRYLKEKHPPAGASMAPDDSKECEIPPWVLEKGVPDWAVNCGGSLLEGREGLAEDSDLEGFIWRPGMEKCTEGIWIWSEVFVCRAGDEDVAVLLMDTQGAWDAKMSKEQSATVFGLTTLLASRLVYNVSKQIQQDKIDNLLYFTDFARAALRSQRVAAQANGREEPFQTLEFLVRDWPHFEENCSLDDARAMMKNHLNQYFDPARSEDTQSVKALGSLFQDIDVWCLPHPSLTIERESWDGDLAVIEKEFWRFIDGYMEKIFSSGQLQAKENLGNFITVDTFGTVLREFIGAFSDAAPQAKTFSEAMEASTSLLARDVAIKKAKEILEEKAGKNPSAVSEQEFEKIAASAASTADREFTSKAIFGTTEGIKQRKENLLREVQEEISRARDENERKLEASLNGLTNSSLLGLAAFAIDRFSDVTCDWWSGFCREASTDLTYVYTASFAWLAFNLYQINQQRGQLEATTAALELSKSVVKQIGKLTKKDKVSDITDVDAKDS